ncbi:MAG: rod shape-determining protein RodA [Blastochloris sp.]|nr:rod shape-determining protein RodA [Blastochloris sp.]
MNPLQKILRLHWLCFITMLGMCVAGYYFIKSATHLSDMPDLMNAARQQLTWLCIGSGVFLVLALTDYKWILRLAPLIYAGMIFILLTVLLFGTEVNGAKSWIRFAGINIQPAEFSKIAFIIGLAWFLQQLQSQIKRFWVILVIPLTMLVPMALILRQPDLGSAAVFMPITFVMMFVAGVRKRYLAIPVLGALAGIWFAFYVVHQAQWNGTFQDFPRSVKEGLALSLPGSHSTPIPEETPTPDALESSPLNKPQPKLQAALSLQKVEENQTVILKLYQLNRIRTFFNPDLDPLGAGWTIRQSLIAVGSGGFKGKGYLKGDQNVYGFLPKNIAYNDFIFSVIAEEWGFVGGSLLILAHGLLILCMISIASRAKEIGGSLLAAGLIGMFFAHFFVNIGMTIKVVPITGIPLPLTSYGGSFLVACLAGLGILQSIWIHKRDYQSRTTYQR